MRTIDPFEVLDGKAIKYIDVFGAKEGALQSKYNGKVYWIYDYYCMHPNCQCNEVYLEFLEAGKAKQGIQHFGVRISFNDGSYKIEDYNIAKQKAAEIIEDTLKHSQQALELFKARYAGMKKKGTDIIVEQANAAKRPIVNETVIGRNDPCPCGSGKKYKKCCGKA